MSEAEYEIYPVNPTIGVWQQVRPLLEPAIDESGGRWDAENVYGALLTGQKTLWVVAEPGHTVAAFVTEIAQYPKKRMIVVHYLGGEGFDAWYPDMLRVVTAHARQRGCHGIEANARFGFWRWFKNDGFIRKSVFYEKPLGKEE